MKRYWLINLTCVVLSAGFLFGTIYMWGWLDSEEIDYETELNVVKNEMEHGTPLRQSFGGQALSMPARQVLPGMAGGEQRNLAASTSLTIQMFLSPSPVSSSNKIAVLPSRYLLSVPFTSQAPEKNWEQPWQDACEEAAILMLDAYYKGYNLSPLFARDEILKMIKWEKESGWGNSIEIEKVKQLVEDFVFKTQNTRLPEPEAQADGGQAINKTQRKATIVDNPTVEDIKKFIANGHPVLVVADGKVLPNPHFRNGGPVYHALIIRGYTETEFITNDPGTQFGRGFKYKYEDLLNAIHDWNGGDVKNGKRVMLVVE